MIFISNAGNLKERNEELMNHPDQIKKCLDLGFNVRVDVKFSKDNFYLVNQEDRFPIETKLLEDYRIWCQAKDILTLNALSSSLNINCFYLKKDKFTITSKSFIWNIDKTRIVKNSIYQMIGDDWKTAKSKAIFCYGICSDIPEVLLNDLRF